MPLSDFFGVFSIESFIRASALMLAFIALLFVGSILLPGKKIIGPVIDGKARTYKLNGLLLFLLTVLVAGLLHVRGLFSLSSLVNEFFVWFIAANLFAFILSGWFYWRGRQSEDSPSSFLGGFFYGTQHSPSSFGVDWKLFSYRPSLIALGLFNLSFGVAQYEQYGQLSLAMILYQAFTFIYVFNYFQFESGMVHTWDLVSERFGWMLIWGDYVLVPFFYCIPAWWLIHSSGSLPIWAAIALCALFLFGFWLFRGANQQKDRFKRDSSAYIWGKPAESMDGRLLVSGFWGRARHLNYTGEICVYLAFTMTTAFFSWIPFLLPAWLISLLWHRSLRDDRRCSAKYGDLWKRYKERVPYSLIPYIY
ncbi:MAG: DUF1295 domain-containing protein [Bacteroidetes bacterium]|nr:DUF1295 domain-containing protein [Bacteroidota bacterium]MCY4223853.1 DUF1295 domain-containing protein [Bacteroidota bacterium]